jgi:hypothetical protein
LLPSNDQAAGSFFEALAPAEQCGKHPHALVRYIGDMHRGLRRELDALGEEELSGLQAELLAVRQTGTVKDVLTVINQRLRRHA